MNRFAFAFLFFTFFAVVGCGSGHQKLSGKVTFTDGSPLKVGIVCFTAEDGSIGRGEIGSDGTYVAGFDSEKNGLPKGGTYKVTVINALMGDGTDKSGMPIMKSLIDLKYNNTKTSGLTYTADGKTKTFNITVDPPK